VLQGLWRYLENNYIQEKELSNINRICRDFLGFKFQVKVSQLKSLRSFLFKSSIYTEEKFNYQEKRYV